MDKGVLLLLVHEAPMPMVPNCGWDVIPAVSAPQPMGRGSSVVSSAVGGSTPGSNDLLSLTRATKVKRRGGGAQGTPTRLRTATTWIDIHAQKLISATHSLFKSLSHTVGPPAAALKLKDRPRGACEFDTFFAPDSTPQSLIEKGIYQSIATMLKGGAWRLVGMKNLAKVRT